MRALFTVIGLLIVVSVVWFALSGGQDPARAERTPVADRHGAPSKPQLEPEPEPKLDGSPAPDPAADVAPDVAPVERLAVPDSGLEPNVEVVAFGTGEAIAGAVVHYRPPDFDWDALDDAGRQRLSALAARDNELFLREVGISVVTDARGRCRVPIGERGTTLIARAGELYGFAHVRTQERSQEPTGEPTGKTLNRVSLRRDRTLRVLVVDAEDRPVPGISVGMARGEGAARPMRWASIGTTDEQGRIEQRHAQLMASGDGASPAMVYAQPPGGESPSVEIDLADVPDEDVVVRLRSTGTVTVQVLEPTGAPLDPRYLGKPVVEMTSLDARPTEPRQELDAFNANRWEATIDEHGRAVFERVVLGRYIVVQIAHRSRFGFDGPTPAIPDVAVTLQLDVDGALFVGRAVSREGEPLASRELMASCRYGGGFGSARCRTDDDGRFRVFLGTHPVGKSITFGLRTSPLARTAKARIEEDLWVELPLRRPVQKGVNDLGDVVVGAGEVIVAGQVVEPDGAPAQRIQLELERQVEGRWRQDWDLRPSWSGDGRFEVRGNTAPGTRLRLAVRSGAHLPVDPIEFAIGQTDLRVELRRGGAVAAVFLVDATTPVQRLRYLLRRADPADGRDGRRDVRDFQARMRERMVALSMQVEDGRAQWTWNGLTPGTYRLTVACPGIDEPVAAVDGIAVTDGPTVDPRLHGVDLRGRVRVLTIRAIGADGQPIADADGFVVVRSQREGGEWFGFHLGAGAAEIVSAGAADLVVFVPGHRMVEVDGVSTDRDIPLESAPVARVRLELGTALPDGYEISLRLEPRIELPRRSSITLDTGRGMGLSGFLRETVRFDAAGEAEVPVRFDAPFAVSAWLGKSGAGGRRVSPIAPGEIELGSAPVTVRVPAAALERAFERR